MKSILFIKLAGYQCRGIIAKYVQAITHLNWQKKEGNIFMSNVGMSLKYQMSLGSAHCTLLRVCLAALLRVCFISRQWWVDKKGEFAGFFLSFMIVNKVNVLDCWLDKKKVILKTSLCEIMMSSFLAYKLNDSPINSENNHQLEPNLRHH